VNELLGLFCCVGRWDRCVDVHCAACPFLCLYVFRRLQNSYDGLKQLFFVDEVHFDWASLVDRYAWGRVGEPVRKVYPYDRRCHVSMIGVYTVNGLIDCVMTEATVDAELFAFFIKNHVVRLPHIVMTLLSAN
jgi:hypothetical protein